MRLTVNDFFDLEQCEHADIFDEVTYPWEALPLFAEYLEFALAQKNYTTATDTSAAAFIGEQVVIGAGTMIEPGVIIQGPALIGKNCLIRSNAYLRSNVIIGDEVIVGNSTELKNCLLFNKVAVPHFNYIGDSILGYRVHLGAGVIISNIKTPPSEIMVQTLEKTYTTGLTKFGAIIGDGVEVGCNTVINPGSIIGQNTTIYPLAMVRGILAPNTILKVKQSQQIVIRR